MGQIARRAVGSSIVAGIIAAVIYIIFAVVEKAGSLSAIALGAVVIGVFTLIVAFIINVIISSIFARRK